MPAAEVIFRGGHFRVAFRVIFCSSMLHFLAFYEKVFYNERKEEGGSMRLKPCPSVIC